MAMGSGASKQLTHQHHSTVEGMHQSTLNVRKCMRVLLPREVTGELLPEGDILRSWRGTNLGGDHD